MAITIDPELERQIEERARANGQQPSEYLRDLIKREQPSRGEQLVAHLRGKATKRLSTDEIMAMTRGED